MIVGYLRKGGVEDIFGGDVSIDDISHYRAILHFSGSDYWFFDQ